MAKSPLTLLCLALVLHMWIDESNARPSDLSDQDGDFPQSPLISRPILTMPGMSDDRLMVNQEKSGNEDGKKKGSTRAPGNKNKNKKKKKQNKKKKAKKNGDGGSESDSGDDSDSDSDSGSGDQSSNDGQTTTMTP